MDFNSINKKIVDESLLLRPISVSDRNFINGLFNNKEIKKYYIVPKEAQQNYQKLIDYWLNDVKNEAGMCWIIIKKGTGFFSRDNEVGFVAFEFRNSVKNARVSYAILPEYRRKGIATDALRLIIENIKKQGVETVEADIDRDNSYSERVVEKLSFFANKRQALVDPEMIRDGEIRMRTLWRKELVEFRKDIIERRISLNANINEITPTINDVVDEINSKGKHPQLLMRYFYLLGRIKFLERNFEESKQAFGQCNMVAMNEGLPEIHEAFYWFAKINEEKGEKESAKMYYEFALEKYNDNPCYITRTEIEKEMSK